MMRNRMYIWEWSRGHGLRLRRNVGQGHHPMVNHPNRRQPEFSCSVSFDGTFASKKDDVRRSGGKLVALDIAGRSFVLLSPDRRTTAELVVRAKDDDAAHTKARGIMAACGLRLS
jgi:hypothetical protein